MPPPRGRGSEGAWLGGENGGGVWGRSRNSGQEQGRWGCGRNCAGGISTWAARRGTCPSLSCLRVHDVRHPLTQRTDVALHGHWRYIVRDVLREGHHGHPGTGPLCQGGWVRREADVLPTQQAVHFRGELAQLLVKDAVQPIEGRLPARRQVLCPLVTRFGVCGVICCSRRRLRQPVTRPLGGGLVRSQRRLRETGTCCIIVIFAYLERQRERSSLRWTRLQSEQRTQDGKGRVNISL